MRHLASCAFLGIALGAATVAFGQASGGGQAGGAAGSASGGAAAQGAGGPAASGPGSGAPAQGAQGEVTNSPAGPNSPPDTRNNATNNSDNGAIDQGPTNNRRGRTSANGDRNRNAPGNRRANDSAQENGAAGATESGMREGSGRGDNSRAQSTQRNRRGQGGTTRGSRATGRQGGATRGSRTGDAATDRSGSGTANRRASNARANNRIVDGGNQELDDFGRRLNEGFDPRQDANSLDQNGQIIQDPGTTLDPNLDHSAIDETLTNPDSFDPRLQQNQAPMSNDVSGRTVPGANGAGTIESRVRDRQNNPGFTRSGQNWTQGFGGGNVDRFFVDQGNPSRASTAPANPTARRAVTQNNGRGWLGLTLSPDFNGNGARISRVATAGPAATAGFRPGDIIVGMNGQPVANYREFVTNAGRLSPHSTARLSVNRGGQLIEMTTTVGALQQATAGAVRGNRPGQGAAPSTIQGLSLPPGGDSRNAIQQNSRTFNQSTSPFTDRRAERTAQRNGMSANDRARRVQQLERQLRSIQNELQTLRMEPSTR